MVKKALIKNGLLFLLAWVVVSCQDDDFTPILPDEQEVPSAKDNLPWPLTQYMDAVNYRPGDDFFMYCNGNYWKTADMGNKKIVGFYDTEMVDALKVLTSSVTNPVYEQLKVHENVEVSNAQFYAFLKPFYEKIDGIQCYEDAFRVAGELRMAGTQKIVDLSISTNKEIRLMVETTGPFDFDGEHLAFLESDNPDDVYQYIATHTNIDYQEAYYEQKEDWYEHEEESAEYEARAEAMVRQYMLPAMGLKAVDLYYQEGFKNWLLIPLEELRAYMKMCVFRDYAAFANQQGFEYMRTRAWFCSSPSNFAEAISEELKKYLDNRLVIERYVSPNSKMRWKGCAKRFGMPTVRISKTCPGQAPLSRLMP